MCRTAWRKDPANINMKMTVSLDWYYDMHMSILRSQRSCACIASFQHTHTPTTNGGAVPKSSNAALFPGCCALLLATRSCPFAYRLYYPYSKSPLRCEQRRRRRRSSTGTGLCVCVCCLFWCCLCPATSAEMLMPLVDRKKSVA